MPRKPLDGVITDKICYADALSEAQKLIPLGNPLSRTFIWYFSDEYMGFCGRCLYEITGRKKWVYASLAKIGENNDISHCAS